MRTWFGSLNDFEKGGVEIVQDDPKNYVFSNVFEVASHAAPYERIAVAKNFEYVVEAVRAEGSSPWYVCRHDEFALSMDGRVEVHLVRPDGVELPDGQGAHRLADDEVSGARMGRILLDRGHMALLPAGAVYRFHADQPAALIIQTVEGPETIFKWQEICQTEDFPAPMSAS